MTSEYPRILLVTPYYKPAFIYGGPVRSLAALCEALHALGAFVNVFTTTANGSEELPVGPAVPTDVSGVEVYYFKRHLLPGWFYSPDLRRACANRMREYDIAYLCAEWTYPMVAASREAIRSGTPFVVSPRGSFMTWALNQKRLKKRVYYRLQEERLLKHAAALHCTSATERDQTLKMRLPAPIEVVPNCVTTPDLPQRGKFRARMGIGANDKLSLYAGRLHKEKRIDLVIESFAAVSARNPDSHLAIVGADDGERPLLEAQVDRLGLRRRVCFPGLLTGNDLLQVYADSDLLVMLSWRESFGMAVAEAMGFGLPVLVGEDVGIATEVNEANAGIVVGPHIQSVVAAWSELLTRDDLKVLGENGRRWVQTRFSARSVAAQMLDMFSRITRNSTRPADAVSPQRALSSYGG